MYITSVSSEFTRIFIIIYILDQGIKYFTIRNWLLSRLAVRFRRTKIQALVLKTYLYKKKFN